MNVLTITQSFVLGGLETRICGEIRWANENGIAMYLATSGDIDEDGLPLASLGITIGLDINETTSSESLLRTVFRLVGIVEQHKINIIHAHPFAALWPAFLVSQLMRIPLVVSMHGPASTNPAQRGMQLQTAFVLPHASLLACVSRETHDLVKTMVCHDRIRTFRNCVDTFRFSPTPNQGSDRWALISRLDEDKKRGVLAFLEMLPDLPINELDIIGQGESRFELEEMARNPKLKLKRIRFIGASYKIDVMMGEYQGIVGMGRVAMEGMAKALPVILVGDDGVKGLFDRKLLKKASYSNFSGRGIENINALELRKSLESESSIVESEHLKKIIHEQYNEAALWREFYDELDMLPFVDCVAFDDLMSIIKKNATNKIPYCEDSCLMQDIQKMLDTYERSIFRSIDFSLDKEAIVSIGSMVRGWRLGGIADNKLRYENDINLKEIEIKRIKNTISWKITRPLRAIHWIINRARNL